VNGLVIALVVLACVLGGGVLGYFFNASLPKHHLSADSKASVTQTVGVLSTLTALVLGLLLATAKSAYDTKADELTQMAADIVLLDRVLAQYGPEAAAARKLLHASTAGKLEELWAETNVRLASLGKVDATAPLEALQTNLRALTPQTDAQRELRSRALSIGGDIAQTRWLILARSGGTIPGPFLVVLVSWLALTFAGLGLIAARNTTVMAAGIAAALAVAGAMFLILELDTPYGGVITISDAPLRLALEHLGRQGGTGMVRERRCDGDFVSRRGYHPLGFT
jgi:hypothetical protein